MNDDDLFDGDVDDVTDFVEWGLRRYVYRIAEGLGVGQECVCTELADQAVAYLALPHHCPDLPDRDVALTWDEVRGWAVGVETGSGEDLLMAAWCGADVLPVPDDVVAFTKAFLAGHPIGQRQPPSQAGGGANIRRQLLGYLSVE